MVDKYVLGGQINLRKGMAGSSSLCEALMGSQTKLLRTKNDQARDHQDPSANSFIICVQEPPVRNRKIVGFNKGGNLFYCPISQRPRAAIYASRDINLWLIPDLTGPDIVTCLWKSGKKEVLICSAYLDINDRSVIPSKLLQVMKRSQNNNLEAIICLDSNSHSSFWGCGDTNKRGEAMEEFILTNGLSVINTGTHFTYFNKKAATIIDVTLATSGIEDKIHGWKVTNQVTGSDHLFIKFSIGLVTETKWRRNFQTGDWDLFRAKLDLCHDNVEDITEWTKARLEHEVDKLHDDIKLSLNESHPYQRVRPVLRKRGWWTKELDNLKREAKRAQGTFRRTRSESDHDRLKEANKAYHKALRKARRKGWREFCSDVRDPAKVALINSIIKGRCNRNLGLVTGPDGTSLSPGNSVKELLETHFPKSLPHAEEREDDLIDLDTSKVNPDDEAADFINEHKVREAIESFGNFKAAGPDDLKPCVLKNLSHRFIIRLTVLYKVSYLHGYTPTKWRHSKVIFIPKPGKDDYAAPRAWRPITLSSFVIKTMERVILWHVNDTALRINPLSRNQHAFRKGRSTESALSNMVEFIEEAIKDNSFALGVFLDIQGAFDNVKPEAIIQGMKAKGIDNSAVNWYEFYLRNRMVEVDHQGITAKRRLTVGTPQGGVFSPLAWNISFDPFLDLFEADNWVEVCGFADDGGLVTIGKNLSVMMSRMQRAVDKAMEWGDSAGLKFSPSKTVVVVFTRKTKFTLPTPLRMLGNEIPFSNEVKYLGITLDHRLTWIPHVTRKIRAAKGHLLQVVNAVGKLWGPQPRMAKWLYTGIVRPALTYGSLVWVKACTSNRVINELTRVNRLALLMLGNFRKGTPTAGLEVLSNTTPLPLYIQGLAIQAWVRTKEHEYLHRRLLYTDEPSKKGHRQICQDLIKQLEIELPPNDFIPDAAIGERKFTIDINSFTDGTPGANADFEVFTDGSKLGGLAGSGFIIYGKDSTWSGSFHLGADPTVFQAEVFAIKQAMNQLRAIAPKRSKIVIYSDSQANLLALNKRTVNSKVVQDAVESLNLLDNSNQITLRWVRAHVGHRGNEKADDLAKIGSTDTNLLTDQSSDMSLKVLKSTINDKIRQRWQVVWSNRSDCRQTKIWFPRIDKKLSYNLIMRSRYEMSLLVQVLTGHNYWKRHQALIDNSDDSECRLCMEDDESSFHILAECPALAWLRQQTFGTHFWEQGNPPPWTLDQVVRFLREASSDFLLRVHPVEGD